MNPIIPSSLPEKVSFFINLGDDKKDINNPTSKTVKNLKDI